MPVCYLRRERERKCVDLEERGQGRWDMRNHNQNILYRKKSVFNKSRIKYCRHPGPLFYKGSSSQSPFGLCFFVLAWISFFTCILRYYFMFLLAIIFINLFRVCYYVNRCPVDTLDQFQVFLFLIERSYWFRP